MPVLGGWDVDQALLDGVSPDDDDVDQTVLDGLSLVSLDDKDNIMVTNGDYCLSSLVPEDP